MESTFSGVDIGENKGTHMAPENFEHMGTDLCRTLLIYENIYVPPELEHLYGKKEEGDANMNSLFADELK